MQELIDSLEYDKEPPLSTGFQELDLLMDGGMRGGELNIIAGRPGQGKNNARN